MKARRWLPATTAIAIVMAIFTPSASSAQGEDQVPRGAAQSPGNAPPDVVDPHVPEEARSRDLGDEWAASEDRMVSAAGSALGYSVLVAAAADGYEWKNLVTLAAPGIETDRWVGNMCLTSDGAKAAVVYAPRAATNDQMQMQQGAFGAIVDTVTGEVTELGRKYTLAYFNPGCGVGNSVVLTAFAEAGGTRLMPFDAATGVAGTEVTLAKQVTSATQDNVGLVAALAGEVIRIGDDGTTSTLATTTGVSHRLQPTADGGLVVVDHDAKTSRVRYLGPDGGAEAPVELAKGDLSEVGVVRDAKGKVYLTGKPNKTTSEFGRVLAPKTVPADSEVSSTGELAVTSIYAFETEHAETPGELKPLVDIEAKSLKTNRKLHFTVPVASGAPDPEAVVGDGPATRSRGVTGSLSDPVEVERYCAVPRNDPKNQVMQPKPRQVEWAVNEAVSGNLTFTRDKNWKNLAIGEYSPQRLFPKPALQGGGSVPAQVVLGVLAQESNLWQASRYTTPGVTGNPLIGNFYGNDSSASSDDKFFTVNWADADCGYGVGQITDGMRLAGKERPGEKAFPYQTQRAIALDYTVNVAAAVKMLSDKWNQVAKAGMKLNNGNPKMLENWFYALWAYNTGFYEKGKDSSGNWGVGWFNNPINPTYNPARGPFLDRSPADAANPQRWPYPEKVLGFAAHSLELQEDADTIVPAFRTAWWLGTDGEAGVKNRRNVKPPVDLFCDSSNKCNPKTTGACPDDSSNCWFHNSATWKNNCDDTCGYEFIRFDPGEYPEQPDAKSYPPNCGTAGLPSGSLIVDNLSNGTPAVRSGCSPVASKGNFQFAFQQGPNGTVPGKMDLHQLGGGFNGHFYFSHNYQEGYLNNRMKITGTWTLGQPLNQWTRIFVHMPDHGAWTQQAAYQVDTGNGLKQRVVLQRHFANTWVSLGVFNISGTPKVTLDNTPITASGEPVQDRKAPRDPDTQRPAADYINNNGVIDIAWDAVAFQPLPAKPKDIVVSMGDSFSSGEGASELNGANYYRSTDHGGNKDSMTSDTMNACHRSTEAWSRKATLPGATKSIGARSDVWDSSLDFQFIACSGAESENLLPYYTVPDGQRPQNAIGESGGKGQWGEVSQLDTGFLDENTTLVTLSIGGNDIGFVPVITACLKQGWDCEDFGKYVGPSLGQATQQRTTVELPKSMDTVLREIRKKAPNAEVMVMGYPNLFERASSDKLASPCLLASGLGGWLSDMSLTLNRTLADAVARSNAANPTGPSARFADPVADFSGKGLCTKGSALNALEFTLSPGDYGALIELGIPGGPNFGIGPSAQSIHPNKLGTDLYANVITRVLRQK